jgi:hypothetical protein
MLLTQNRELRQDGVWNFTLPAWVVELPDGSHFNVCPQAGACAKFCYARNGTYLFPKVRGKHLRNLEIARSEDFYDAMVEELSHKRFRATGVARVIPGLDDVSHLSAWTQEWMGNGGQAVRIHDSGDFFDDTYLLQWIDIANAIPDVLFYAYTKEVALVQGMQDGSVPWPDNFLVCFSMGGRQDHFIDPDVDRHADVFPDFDSMTAAGYMSQHLSDLLCVLLPTTRIGIPQNNIPHVKKKLAGRTFAEAQAERRR